MTLPEPRPWSRGSVVIATSLMILVSGLVLAPRVNATNILTALRLTSVTTASPFILVFSANALARWSLTRGLGQWGQQNRPNLWLILTISHFLHLYQIWLFSQLSEGCPLHIWVICTPLWIIMAGFAMVAIARPQAFYLLQDPCGNRPLTRVYHIGLWYIWFVFVLAFGLSAFSQHLVFYNVPALTLFLAGAIANGLSLWHHNRL